MIKHSRSHGFAHAFLITGLVIALIVALGFVFWQNFIHKEPVAKSDTVVVTKNDESNSEKSQAKSFLVEDYDVEFKIPTELSGTTIKYEARQIGEASFLAFTTQRVVDLGGDCANGHPFGDLVTLSRNGQSKSDEYEVYTSGEINGYYYHVGTVDSSGLIPQSTCTSNSQAKSDENSLVEALKSLTPQS